MLPHTLPAAIDATTGRQVPLLSETHWFHAVRVLCQTNHAASLKLLSDMLRLFPVPEHDQGEVRYSIFCFEESAQFPLPLPRDRKRLDTLRLLTNTRLKSYRGSHDDRRFLSYDALAGVNGTILSVIDTSRHEAFTQIELPIEYQATFLRRYVFLLALGQLMLPFGFEPCHAAVVSAPWDDQCGALIVGGSGNGKTTLSVGCASEGFGLLGDDLIMLRADSMDTSIGAYAISHEVSMRSATLDLWPNLRSLASLPADQRDKRYCHIEAIRPGAPRLRTTIRLLLFPSLTGAKDSTIIPLSKAQALQRLLDKCLSRSALPEQERLFRMLSALAEQAPAYEIVMARGANDGPRLIRALMAGDIS